MRGQVAEVPDHSSGVHAASYHLAVESETHPGYPHKRSIVAAAQTLVDSRIKRRLPMPKGSKAGSSWDQEAWELYNETPELHFAVTWAANMLSGVRLVAAEVGDDGQPQAIHLDTDQDGDPETDTPADEQLDEAQRLAATEVSELAGGPVGQAQLLSRAGQHLLVPGESYIVMRPLDPPPDAADLEEEEDGTSLARRLSDVARRRERPATRPLPTSLDVELDDEAETDADANQWLVRAYTRDEVGADGQGRDARWWVDEGNGKEYLPDEHLVLRVWRPHPKTFQHADSAVRATLPVLRELRGLTMHVSAQVDSRLAGAGLLALPQEMTFATAGPRDDDADDDEEDPFMRELIQAMTVPIKDRESAAAVVPIVIKVPGQFLKEIKYISFATPLDAKAKDLREEAIRRMALGLDMPPEMLLGLADVNHWSGWLADASAIKISTAPLAALICHVLTTGWLRPLLEESGIPTARARRIMVWFDTSDLEVKPTGGESATAGYNLGVVGSDAWLRENGLTEADKPSDEEFQRWLLVKLVLARPDLAEVILPALGIQLHITTTTDSGVDTDASGGDDTPGNGRAPGGDRSLPERETTPPEVQGDTPEGVAAALLQGAQR